MAPPPTAAPAIHRDFGIPWPVAPVAPVEPVEPVVRVHPVARAVQLLLTALMTSNADRIVLKTEEVPLLVTGKQKYALMNYRPSLQGVQEIATYVFPQEYLEALEEIGATRYQWPGYDALAEYGELGLTIEIKRVR